MKEEVFELIFQGEYVEIIQSIDSSEGHMLPVAIYGYVLDTDDMFVFLGDSPGEITTAVLKSGIKIMRIAEPRSEEDELLDSLEEPKRDEDFN